MEISTAARLSSRLPIISSAKAMLGLVWIGWGYLAGPFRPLATGAVIPFTVCGLALLGASVLSWWRGNALASQVTYSDTSTFFTVRQVNSGWLRVVLITSALIVFSILVLTRLSEAISDPALGLGPVGPSLLSAGSVVQQSSPVSRVLRHRYCDPRSPMYSLPLAQIPFSVGLGTGAVLWASVDLGPRQLLQGPAGTRRDDRYVRKRPWLGTVGRPCPERGALDASPRSATPRGVLDRRPCR